ncbi:hypothetical protein LIER_10584 [Lithospermum erythrorhizon]|uniref:Uncharacterized protein n=1 Tax=Lithospermum erythrorhizon TaxID=34254 RepID=A0AAV3PLV1_LITER
MSNSRLNWYLRPVEENEDDSFLWDIYSKFSSPFVYIKIVNFRTSMCRFWHALLCNFVLWRSEKNGFTQFGVLCL